MHTVDELYHYICEHTDEPKAAAEALIALLSTGIMKQSAAGEEDAA